MNLITNNKRGNPLQDYYVGIIDKISSSGII